MIKWIATIVMIFALGVKSSAQNCTIRLSGRIVDKGTNVPLSYATIKLVESGQGIVADSIGYFTLDRICPGEYHILISHVGFEIERFFVVLDQDTEQDFTLNHYDELLNEIVIHSEHDFKTAVVSHTITNERIEEEGNKNLSDLIGNIAGVSVLKNGSGISKPVIHGLYGNRVTVLNNGIQQAGQQWGNDHAPEIDPFVANHISVIKGVAGLQYSGGSLGGVVLVEPSTISPDPHLHGDVNYIFQSNGLGHTLNSKIEKSSPWASWRVTGTIKMVGDNQSPDYLLTNTGKKESNIALQLEKNISDKWLLKTYYSFFHTEIGILRGSHIGNLTDLQEAVARAEPFFTTDNFSYDISAPRQVVNHHLLKLGVKYMLSENRTLTLNYGGQMNLRDEFDVRRSGRSEKPALSLGLQSHYVEGIYEHFFEKNIELKAGVQNTFNQNTNDNAETGLLPLIPDYYSNTLGSFLTINKKIEHTTYEIGARYDLKSLHVTTITTSLPRRIERFSHNFHNYSIAGGVSQEFNSKITTNLNIGFAQRSPEVNELYSNGLHQGVSGIERGNSNLLIEKSFKIILSNDLSLSDQLFFQAIGYFQDFKNYIYLQPANEFELTIRGAFPAFHYNQTGAQIFGSDLVLTYEPYRSAKINLSYAFLRGIDKTENSPLIYMPPNNLSSSLTHSLHDIGIFNNNTLSVNANYVFKQNQYEEGQDVIAPPEGYFLLDIKAGTAFNFKNSSLKLSLKAENVLNKKYRDYLNRLRYFANETGINFNISANYTF